jgi:hypothetical protein
MAFLEKRTHVEECTQLTEKFYSLVDDSVAQKCYSLIGDTVAKTVTL